jgi:hypothetical protein
VSINLDSFARWSGSVSQVDQIWSFTVEDACGDDVDCAVLQKLYRTTPEAKTRYSPAKCIGVRSQDVTGNPGSKHVSTGYVGRQNLTMRTAIRRFTRLKTTFSKTLANQKASWRCLHAPQFRAHSSVTEGHARDGGGLAVGCGRLKISQSGRSAVDISKFLIDISTLDR